MKHFIISVSIGLGIGTLFAAGFLFVKPRLPDIFAEAFFYPSMASPVTVIQDIQNIFKPDTNQYFIPLVDDTISTSTKIVYADVGLMNIVLYENGQKVGEYPIQSVGREGTAWQTPLGTFDMNYKKENHFSSIGHVWMPYSMHFFGNYFIHGWPYYESGMPVAEGYSGGCIRLNTDDAKNIYKFVDKNTELIVTTNKKPEIQKEFQYDIKEESPVISASYLVVDIETGEVISAHNAQEKAPIGSFTKLMTGLISLETLNQYQETIFDQDIVHISDVLYALLLEDTDDAGHILYEHKNKSQYLIDMNTRAKSLAMNMTTYADPNGDDVRSISSLEDTFKLLHYIYSYKPFFIQVLSLDSYKKDTVRVASIHPLIKQEGYVAGFSNDTQNELITLVTLKDTPLSGKTFALIVHNSSSAQQDTEQLIEWIKQSVHMREM